MFKYRKAFSISILLLTCSFHSYATTILYEDTFDAPFSPSYSTVFGDVDVVAPVGPLTTNALAFNSTGNSTSFYYDQIKYGIDEVGSPYAGTAFDVFNVSFDIYTEALVGSNNQFTLLFDTPTVRTLNFTGAGDIRVSNIGSGSSGVIASFLDQQLLSIDILFDISSNQWDIFVDDALLYSDQMDADYLRSIRFSHGAASSNTVDFNATTYLDNILISSPVDVPEPSSLALLSLLMAGFLAPLRKRCL